MRNIAPIYGHFAHLSGRFRFVFAGHTLGGFKSLRIFGYVIVENAVAAGLCENQAL